MNGKTCAILALTGAWLFASAPLRADEEGAEYRGWCRAQAQAEKVAAEAFERYQQGCMQRLARADQKQGDRQRGRDQDDESRD